MRVPAGGAICFRVMAIQGTELARRIAHVLRDHDDVLAAYLFGSRASERHRPDSDVDVAVIFSAATPDEARFQLRCMLGGRIAAASGVDSAHVIDLENAPPLLAHEVLHGGRLLFSRDEDRRVRIVARQVMRYIDTAPMRRVLDEATFRRLREGSFGRIS